MNILVFVFIMLFVLAFFIDCFIVSRLKIWCDRLENLIHFIEKNKE